jgi:hypothetical protein
LVDSAAGIDLHLTEGTTLALILRFRHAGL